MSKDFEEEEIWLRHRLRRMRALLRYAKEIEVEVGLRELIADAGGAARNNRAKAESETATIKLRRYRRLLDRPGRREAAGGHTRKHPARRAELSWLPLRQDRAPTISQHCQLWHIHSAAQELSETWDLHVFSHSEFGLGEDGQGRDAWRKRVDFPHAQLRLLAVERPHHD
jgi:hypothetical protein